MPDDRDKITARSQRREDIAVVRKRLEEAAPRVETVPLSPDDLACCVDEPVVVGNQRLEAAEVATVDVVVERSRDRCRIRCACARHERTVAMPHPPHGTCQ
jgi:hypothetical protein